VFEADLAPVDINNESEMLDWFDDRLGVQDEPGQAVFHTVVANQILGDDPPVAWSTVQRLQKAGLGRDAIVRQMVMVVGAQLGFAWEAGRTESTSEVTAQQSLAQLTTQYNALPLPDVEALRTTVIETVVASEWPPIDDVVAEALSRLDAEPDTVVEAMLDRTIDMMLDGGELAMLATDRVVHVSTILNSIALTHVTEDFELELGVLSCIGTDLAGFGHVSMPRMPNGDAIEVYSLEADHLAWKGPKGWLDGFEAGDAIKVWVDDEVVGIAKIDLPAPNTELAVRLGECMEREVVETTLPVTFVELLIALLVDDSTAFDSPERPLTQLYLDAGLETDGGLVAVGPEGWAELQQSRRFNRVRAMADDSEMAFDVLAVLEVVEDTRSTQSDLRDALRELDDPDICRVVLNQLISDDLDVGDPAAAGVVADGLLLAARRPIEQAVAHFVAGVVAERSRDVMGARELFTQGMRHYAGYAPLVDRAAWYASDSGDAVGATRLWDMLEDVDPGETETVRSYTVSSGSSERRIGRNDPCWCGSGRKFKKCHLGQRELVALPDRVAWLARKATGFLVRRSGEANDTVFGLAMMRATEPDRMAEAFEDPIVIDAALTEEGWFETFIELRGELLPADELLLAQSWLLVDRSVHEVLEVDPGVGLTVRDLRTGDVLEVRERAMSRHAKVGSLFCARPVPDGETHQFIGGLFAVEPGREAAVLSLCDEGDGFELCSYRASLDRPPEIRTRENEPLVTCELVASVNDVEEAKRVLDGLYDREPGASAREHRWVEMHPIAEDEDVLRATLTFDDGRLRVLTHSEERMDRVLATIASRIDGFTVVSDGRVPLAPDEMPSIPSGFAGGQPEIDAETRDEIMAVMENKWISEPVPALGGLTPIEAVADPTRRDDVLRLIDSFPDSGLGSEFMMLRKDKLRKALDL